MHQHPRLIAAAFAFVLPTAACGQQPSDPAYARQVADSTSRDCVTARAQAPNAAFAHHLDRLCKCVHDKIAATPMSRNDSERAMYEKIQAGAQACQTELGGAPNAEDYRTTGIRPPADAPH